MRTILTLLAALAFALALALIIGRTDGPETAGLPIGQPAPDFTARTLDGQAVSLGGLRGKVVVLDFWATWCGPCRAMIPHERDLVKKYAGRPFAFLGVSADADPDALRNFLAAQGITWPTIHDGPGGPLGELYRVEFFPFVYVLDVQGVIRFKHVRGRELEEAVEKLLAAAPG
jgi:thiol-disulfide isomerase/thioredoxin